MKHILPKPLKLKRAEWHVRGNPHVIKQRIRRAYRAYYKDAYIRDADWYLV